MRRTLRSMAAAVGSSSSISSLATERWSCGILLGSGRSKGICLSSEFPAGGAPRSLLGESTLSLAGYSCRMLGTGCCTGTGAVEVAGCGGVGVAVA